MVSNNLVSLQTLLRVNNDDKIVGAIEMEEEWKSVYEEQSARIAKAVSGLASAVGSSTNVDPLPYLRLTLELSQSHHDNIYAIRVQISELAKSITAIENRLELLEKRESNSSQ